AVVCSTLAGSTHRRGALDRCGRPRLGRTPDRCAVPSACGIAPSGLRPGSYTHGRRTSPAGALLGRWCVPGTRGHPAVAGRPQSVPPGAPSAAALTVSAGPGCAVPWGCAYIHAPDPGAMGQYDAWLTSDKIWTW